MGFGWLSHTADTGIELWAGSLSEIFVEAVRALTQTVVDLSAVEPRETARVVCAAGALDLLLVTFLEELLYEFEVRGRVFAEADVNLAKADGSWRLDAILRGERYDVQRHGLKVPIKGVTYHGLELVETGAGWRGRVVFDI